MSLATLFSVIVLLVLAGFLAGSESALTSLSRLLIEQIIDAKPKYANRFSRFTENPARYLNVLLLVRKSCELTATVLVAAAFIEITDNKALALTQTIVLMVAISYVIVGVGPRTLGKQNALSWSKPAIITADLLSKLLSPLTNLLIKVGNAITPGKGFKSGPFSTEAEFRDLVDQASESGFVEESEREMIHSVFDLGETMVRELMVPRTEMVWIESGKNLRQGLSLALRSGFTRIPVISENLDNVVGIAYVKDLARRVHENHDAEQSENVEEHLRKATYVPETKTADELLKQMQRDQIHMAIVVDEYSGVAGMITIEDVIEQIVGDIEDEHDIDEDADNITVLKNGDYRIKGITELDQLNEDLNTQFEADDVETVAGLVIQHLGRVPKFGERVRVNDFEFEVQRADPRQVHILLMRRIVPNLNSPTEA